MQTRSCCVVQYTWISPNTCSLHFSERENSQSLHSLYASCVTLYPFTEGSGLALLSLNLSHYGQGERLSDTVISVTLVCVNVCVWGCICLMRHLAPIHTNVHRQTSEHVHRQTHTTAHAEMIHQIACTHTHILSEALARLPLGIHVA